MYRTKIYTIFTLIGSMMFRISRLCFLFMPIMCPTSASFVPNLLMRIGLSKAMLQLFTINVAKRQPINSSFVVGILYRSIYRVDQKSKPLPTDQKIVLNRIKACQ